MVSWPRFKFFNPGPWDFLRMVEAALAQLGGMQRQRHYNRRYEFGPEPMDRLGEHAFQRSVRRAHTTVLQQVDQCVQVAVVAAIGHRPHEQRSSRAAFAADGLPFSVGGENPLSADDADLPADGLYPVQAIVANGETRNPGDGSLAETATGGQKRGEQTLRRCIEK